MEEKSEENRQTHPKHLLLLLLTSTRILPVFKQLYGMVLPRAKKRAPLSPNNESIYEYSNQYRRIMIQLSIQMGHDKDCRFLVLYISVSS